MGGVGISVLSSRVLDGGPRWVRTQARMVGGMVGVVDGILLVSLAWVENRYKVERGEDGEEVRQ